MEIRYATSMDNPYQISKVYEDSWKFAYQGLIPQNYLDSIPAGRWVSGIEKPNRKTLVCVEDGRILGQAALAAPVLNSFSDGVK